MMNYKGYNNGLAGRALGIHDADPWAQIHDTLILIHLKIRLTKVKISKLFCFSQMKAHGEGCTTKATTMA